MQVLLQREMARLKNRVLSLSAMAEENVRLALKAVEQGDSSLVDLVKSKDREIDLLEVDIEEDCLKTLALHQPVANDLRVLIAILKINIDLERIGDLAVNIAEQVGPVSDEDPVDKRGVLPIMASRAQAMLRKSLDSVVNLDTTMAREVLEADDEVDRYYQDIKEEVMSDLKQMPVNVDGLVRVMEVSRQIERIADLATNIAEDTIYIVDGDIVRHGQGIVASDE